MKAFGTRPTYQIFAGITLFTGLIYFSFNLLYLKKRPQVEGNDIVKKQKKPKKLNDSENGIIEVDINGRQELSKDKSCCGVDNEAYSKEKSDELELESKDVEVTKNAKNLQDKIEKTTEELNRRSIREAKERSKDPEERVENGVVNLTFKNDNDTGCSVTIERESDDKK